MDTIKQLTNEDQYRADTDIVLDYVVQLIGQKYKIYQDMINPHALLMHQTYAYAYMPSDIMSLILSLKHLKNGMKTGKFDFKIYDYKNPKILKDIFRERKQKEIYILSNCNCIININGILYGKSYLTNNLNVYVIQKIILKGI